MNEIIKLYENAGVENYRLHSFVGFVPNGYKAVCYEDNPNKVKEVVREFTAEKQIEILKLILKKRRILDVGYIIEEEKYHCMHYERVFDSFEEALCADVNYHWQSLTEEDKINIKNILEM